jgi:hypothetical protein
MYEVFKEEMYQLMNITFLRLEIASHCRECTEARKKSNGNLTCEGCRILKVRDYLNDTGQQADSLR